MLELYSHCTAFNNGSSIIILHDGGETLQSCSLITFGRSWAVQMWLILNCVQISISWACCPVLLLRHLTPYLRYNSHHMAGFPSKFMLEHIFCPQQCQSISCPDDLFLSREIGTVAIVAVMAQGPSFFLPFLLINWYRKIGKFTWGLYPIRNSKIILSGQKERNKILKCEI